MVKVAEHNDWLLETAVSSERVPSSQKPHRAWVSNPERYVVGYAIGDTEADAVRAALIDAAGRCRKDLGALAGLEKEYFGLAGLLTTRAEISRSGRGRGGGKRSAMA